MYDEFIFLPINVGDYNRFGYILVYLLTEGGDRQKKTEADKFAEWVRYTQEPASDFDLDQRNPLSAMLRNMRQQRLDASSSGTAVQKQLAVWQWLNNGHMLPVNETIEKMFGKQNARAVILGIENLPRGSPVSNIADLVYHLAESGGITHIAFALEGQDGKQADFNTFMRYGTISAGLRQGIGYGILGLRSKELKGSQMNDFIKILHNSTSATQKVRLVRVGGRQRSFNDRAAAEDIEKIFTQNKEAKVLVLTFKNFGGKIPYEWHEDEYFKAGIPKTDCMYAYLVEYFSGDASKVVSVIAVHKSNVDENTALGAALQNISNGYPFVTMTEGAPLAKEELPGGMGNSWHIENAGEFTDAFLISGNNEGGGGESGSDVPGGSHGRRIPLTREKAETPAEIFSDLAGSRVLGAVSQNGQIQPAATEIEENSVQSGVIISGADGEGVIGKTIDFRLGGSGLLQGDSGNRLFDNRYQVKINGDILVMMRDAAKAEKPVLLTTKENKYAEQLQRKFLKEVTIDKCLKTPVALFYAHDKWFKAQGIRGNAVVVAHKFGSQEWRSIVLRVGGTVTHKEMDDAFRHELMAIFGMDGIGLDTADIIEHPLVHAMATRNDGQKEPSAISLSDTDKRGAIAKKIGRGIPVVVATNSAASDHSIPQKLASNQDVGKVVEADITAGTADVARLAGQMTLSEANSLLSQGISAFDEGRGDFEKARKFLEKAKAIYEALLKYGSSCVISLNLITVQKYLTKIERPPRRKKNDPYSLLKNLLRAQGPLEINKINEAIGKIWNAYLVEGLVSKIDPKGEVAFANQKTTELLLQAVKRLALPPEEVITQIKVNESMKQKRKSQNTAWIMNMPMSMEELKILLKSVKERSFEIIRDRSGAPYIVVSLGGGYATREDISGSFLETGMATATSYLTNAAWMPIESAKGHSHSFSHKKIFEIEVTPDIDYNKMQDKDNFILQLDVTQNIHLLIQRAGTSEFEEIKGEKNIIKELARLGLIIQPMSGQTLRGIRGAKKARENI